jgi:hypothetical protein
MEKNIKIKSSNSQSSRLLRIYTYLSKENIFRIKKPKTINLDLSKSKPNGQAIFFVLVLLPLLALLFNYLLQFLILLQTKMMVQKQCREQTFLAQKKIVNGFNKLIDLNPEAKALRRRKRSALRAVRNARHPYTLAAATAYLAFVEGQQRVFQAKQQLIITSSKSKAKIEVLKIKGQNYRGTPPFALVARPITSSSPSYHSPNNLNQKQDLIVRWKIKNSLNQTQEGQCGSHIKKTIIGFQIKYSYPDTRFLK